MDKQVDLTDFDDCMVVGADLDFLHNQKKRKQPFSSSSLGQFKKSPVDARPHQMPLLST